MQLRHISPRSSDWMDAMDEGSGGRGWEKLAPEERVKLLRERRAGDAQVGEGQRPSAKAALARGEPQGFELGSASR